MTNEKRPMTNKYRLIRLEKAKSALESGRDELPFNTIKKDHKGHEGRELTLRCPERRGAAFRVAANTRAAAINRRR